MKTLWAALVLVATTASAEPWQGITAAAASPDGRWFATGGREGELLLWESSTGEIQARWAMAPLPVAAVMFSSDGTSLGAIGLDGTCVTVNFSDGSIAPAEAKGMWKPLATAPSQALSRSPTLFGVSAATKDLQARGSPEGLVTVTPSGGAPLTWQAHEAAVTGLVFLPGGVLLSACYDGSLAKWDARTGRELGRL